MQKHFISKPMLNVLQRTSDIFKPSSVCTLGNRAQKRGLLNTYKNGNNKIFVTRRCKSTSNKNDASSKENQVLNRRAPEININPTEGNTVLHQKAARAAELHAELNTLLDAQAKRRAEELNRPLGAGFLNFLKKSKSEIINIFAAFACVLLAFQVSNIRKGARKLLEEAEQKELRMEKLKKILRALSSEEFSDRVVQVYEERLLSNSKVNEVEKSLKDWFLNRRIREETNDQHGSNGNNLLLKDILRSELQKTIGDVALTAYELEEKRLNVLQKEMGIVDTKTDGSKSISSSDSSLGALEQILVEAQQGSDPDSGKKVVKRKGFI